jgi:hypothetical protein
VSKERVDVARKERYGPPEPWSRVDSGDIVVGVIKKRQRWAKTVPDRKRDSSSTQDEAFSTLLSSLLQGTPKNAFNPVPTLTGGLSAPSVLAVGATNSALFPGGSGARFEQEREPAG